MSEPKHVYVQDRYRLYHCKICGFGRGSSDHIEAPVVLAEPVVKAPHLFEQDASERIISRCKTCGSGEADELHIRACGKAHIPYAPCLECNALNGVRASGHAPIGEVNVRAPVSCLDGSHCWHEVNRYTERSGTQENSIGAMVKTERCCFCDAHENLYFDLVRPDDHGPHAPLIWKLTRAIPCH